MTFTFERLCPRLFPALLAFVLLVAACGVSRGGDEPVATVTFADGSSAEIDRTEFESVTSGIRSSERFVELAYQDAVVPEDLDANILSQMIISSILENSLAEAGGAASPDALAVGRTELLDELESAFANNGDADPAETSREVAAEIDAYVELLSRQFVVGDELTAVLSESGEGGLELPCVSHILVDDEADADSIVADLAEGADFAAIAMEKSTDPGSGAAGGELGCQSVDAWVPEFRDAVVAAEIGEIVGPVESQFGYHVILVTDVEVDNSAAANLKIQEAVSAVTVDVDPLIGSWDPAFNGVIPPTAE